MAAYILAVCKITNVTDKFKEYSTRSADLVHRHGGKYVIRGPKKFSIKGDLLDDKVVILIEFPSMDELNAFLNDPEYVNEVGPLREGTGEYHFAAYEAPPPEAQ